MHGRAQGACVTAGLCSYSCPARSSSLSGYMPGPRPAPGRLQGRPGWPRVPREKKGGVFRVHAWAVPGRDNRGPVGANGRSRRDGSEFALHVGGQGGGLGGAQRDAAPKGLFTIVESGADSRHGSLGWESAALSDDPPGAGGQPAGSWVDPATFSGKVVDITTSARASPQSVGGLRRLNSWISALRRVRTSGAARAGPVSLQVRLPPVHWRRSH